MRRFFVLLASTTLLVACFLPIGEATAASSVAAFRISGTATSTCTSTSGDLNLCDFGATTTTDAIGATGTCTGTCPTTQGTVEIQYGFVKFPPNPCHANKLTGTLTLTFPTDPTYPPNPWFVNLTGHVIDSHSVTLTGTPSSSFGLYPPVPMRVTVATAFPPSPCRTGTGSFTGLIAIG
jgi:hypothetical protein